MCLIVGEGKWPSEVAVILAGPSRQSGSSMCAVRACGMRSQKMADRAGARGIVRRVRIHSFRDFDSMAMRLTGVAEKPPASLGRDILALAIAYARQERRYGGLARLVAKELDRLRLE